MPINLAQQINFRPKQAKLSDEEESARKQLLRLIKQAQSQGKLQSPDLDDRGAGLRSLIKKQDKGDIASKIQGLVGNPIVASILGGLGGFAFGGPVGAILGAGVGGGIGSTLKQDIEGEERDLGEIAREAALGAGGEALGLGAARVLGPVIKGSAKKIETFGKEFRKGVSKPKVPSTPFASRDEDIIQAGLKELGFKGSARAQKAQMPEIFDKLTTKVNAKLSKITTPIKTAPLFSKIDEALEQTINFNPAIKAYVNAKDKFLSQLVNVSNKTKTGLVITPRELFNFKQSLGRQLKRAFDKVSGKSQVALTPAEEVGLAIWESVDDMLPKAVNTLTRTQSLLFKAAPGIIESAEKGVSLPFGAGRLPFISPTLQAGQDIAGRGLQAAGRGLQGLPTIPGVAAAGRAGVRAVTQPAVRAPFGGEEPIELPGIEQGQLPGIGADSLGVEAGAAEQQGNFQTSPDGEFKTDLTTGQSFSINEQWVFDPASNEWVPNPNAPQGQETGGLGQNPYPIENLIGDIQRDPENAAFYKYIFEQYQKQYAAEDSKLSADQSKRLGKLAQAVSIIDTFEGKLEEIGLEEFGPTARVTGFTRGLAAKVGLEPKISAFRKARQGARVMMARSLGEVGNLSEAEQAAALDLIPDIGMSREEVRNNVALIKTLVENLRQGIINQPQSQNGSITTQNVLPSITGGAF